jgi:hypothetical protein
MKRLSYLFLLFVFAACKKEGAGPQASYVSVRFQEEEDYVMMEIVEGSWDNKSGTATLNATGYHFEQFRLSLPHVSDTGNYKNPCGDNIFFTKSADFLPSKLDSGDIHISYVDEYFVKGDFTVLLEDSIHGQIKRMATGNFGIYRHP